MLKYLLLLLLVNITYSQSEFYATTRVGNCENGVHQRPSIYTLSQKQWDNYVNAIYKLNNGTRPTKWDKLSQLHQSIYSSIHSKASFFSWHRAFLFVLERELQNIDPSVVIPYWDWTNYSQNPENDPVFASRRFGGNGVPSNNNQIDDGSFANFKVYGGNNVHLLKRSFNQIDKKMTPWLSPDVINGMILNSKDFKTFWNRVEAGPHGLIHNGIGADFSGHGSPSDPLFYSHHAFVDKLWYTWVKRGNGERDTEYAFDDTVPNLDAKLNSFNITTRDVMDTENNLCYYYPEDHYSWTQSAKLTRRNGYDVNELFNKANQMTLIKPIDAYTEVECDETQDLREYNLNYVMNGINAPSAYDRSDKYKLRVPIPQREEFLLTLGYDVSMVRQLERQFAQFISVLNSDKNFISEAALVNQNKFPKLKSKCNKKGY